MSFLSIYSKYGTDLAHILHCWTEDELFFSFLNLYSSAQTDADSRLNITWGNLSVFVLLLLEPYWKLYAHFYHIYSSRLHPKTCKQCVVYLCRYTSSSLAFGITADAESQALWYIWMFHHVNGKPSSTLIRLQPVASESLRPKWGHLFHNGAGHRSL